jgi:orotidine-5'-phosphate decarboxylase
LKSLAPFLNPICVALDVNTGAEALRIAQELEGFVGGFKIGPRLIHREGAQITQDLARLGPVFVDCKFFDIPSTMIAAVRSSFESGASVCTVHALSGKEALVAMAELEAELSRIRPFKILAVTILTSWSSASYPPVFKSVESVKNVRSLAEFAIDCGLKSIVCSGEELPVLKDLDLFKVTPGIRPEGASHQDQSRVLTPQKAIAAGSDVLVIGRPILESSQRAQLLSEILKSL